MYHRVFKNFLPFFRWGISSLAFFILIFGCSTNPSGRTLVTITRQDGKTVTCSKPPPDILSKAGSLAIDAETKKLGKIIKATISGRIDVEKIREISKHIAEFEVIHYRICLDYSNGVFSPEEYQAFERAILGLKKKPRLETDPEANGNQRHDAPSRIKQETQGDNSPNINTGGDVNINIQSGP